MRIDEAAGQSTVSLLVSVGCIGSILVLVLPQCCPTYPIRRASQAPPDGRREPGDDMVHQVPRVTRRHLISGFGVRVPDGVHQASDLQRCGRGPRRLPECSHVCSRSSRTAPGQTHPDPGKVPSDWSTTPKDGSACRRRRPAPSASVLGDRRERKDPTIVSNIPEPPRFPPASSCASRAAWSSYAPARRAMTPSSISVITGPGRRGSKARAARTTSRHMPTTSSSGAGKIALCLGRVIRFEEIPVAHAQMGRGEDVFGNVSALAGRPCRARVLTPDSDEPRETTLRIRCSSGPGCQRLWTAAPDVLATFEPSGRHSPITAGPTPSPGGPATGLRGRLGQPSRIGRQRLDQRPLFGDNRSAGGSHEPPTQDPLSSAR